MPLSATAALLPAELAWYVTGRFYRGTDGKLADYGYFIHLAGIDAGLFAGAPGEATAHFTFAATPFAAASIANGALALALDAVGDFALFLQREPAGTFDDPASFARGECIARFRRTGVVVGTTVDATAVTQAQAIFASNVFSARLLASTPFELAGRRYDLRDLVGQGVTQFGTAAGAAIQPPPAGYSAALPFTGSAVALGR